jgi:hypothetical protein
MHHCALHCLDWVSTHDHRDATARSAAPQQFPQFLQAGGLHRGAVSAGADGLHKCGVQGSPCECTAAEPLSSAGRLRAASLPLPLPLPTTHIQTTLLIRTSVPCARIKSALSGSEVTPSPRPSKEMAPRAAHVMWRHVSPRPAPQAHAIWHFDLYLLVSRLGRFWPLILHEIYLGNHKQFKQFWVESSYMQSSGLFNPISFPTHTCCPCRRSGLPPHAQLHVRDLPACNRPPECADVKPHFP